MSITNTTAPTPTDRVGEDVEYVGMDARAGEPQDDPDAGLTHWQIAEEIGALAREGRGITATTYAAIERAWQRGFQAGHPSAPAPSDPAGAGGDLDWLLRQVIELCEDTETKTDEALSKGPTNEQEIGFYRGRAYEAKGVRRAITEVARLREEDRSGQIIASTPEQKGAGGDLGELERLSKAATQGEWSQYDGSYGGPSLPEEHRIYGDTNGGYLVARIPNFSGYPENKTNAAYIVALVNAHRSGQLVASTPGQKGAGEEKTGAPASQETLATIAAWCEQTFGTVTPERVAKRAAEEMDELLAEPTKVEEAADVVIVLSRYPGLWEAVERKMAVNRARKWRLMGDGTGYHVKAPSESPSTKEASE